MIYLFHLLIYCTIALQFNVKIRNFIIFKAQYPTPLNIGFYEFYDTTLQGKCNLHTYGFYDTTLQGKCNLNKFRI